MGRAVGIDLGTTNSCVAVIESGQPVVIPNADGQRTTPSVVAFEANGKVLVGAQALRQAALNPERTVHSVKRLIGQRFESDAVSELSWTLPFCVAPNENGDACVQIDERLYTPQQISAHVLEALKTSAEAHLDEPVDEAVITVPAYFNDAQRQATRDAARIAGLKVKRMINEPTAAALAYGAGKKQRRGRWAVFDLGGGTFDVSILAVDGEVFEVVATAGDTALGGVDFDSALLEAIAAEVEKRSGVSIRENPVCLQRLRGAVESARCELSTANETVIRLPYLTASPDGPVHIDRTTSRAQLTEMTHSVLRRLEGPLLSALREARVTPQDLDEVLLVGGVTRMPAVREIAARLLGRAPNASLDPHEAVAVGAAWQVACLRGDIAEVLLLDVTPQNLGVGTKDGWFSTVIPKNRTIPTEEHKLFATTQDDQDFVTIEIYQGDARSVADNSLLGRFVLTDLPAGTAGSVRVDVGFHIDANGIIRVSARHEGSGREAKVTVQARSGLTPEEVDRIAREHARLR